MTQALQEKDLARLLSGAIPLPEEPGMLGSPHRRRRTRRVRWRLRPRAAVVQRFLAGALAFSLAGILAAGSLGLPSGPLASALAWGLATVAALWVLGASERPLWLRFLASLTLPVLTAGWVVGAQRMLPVGTGASAGLVALGIAALGLRLVGYPLDYRVFSFLPALALLSVPLELGWAQPGAGQYTLAANLVVWGSLALTVPLEQGAGWRPRVLSLDLAVGAEGPATVGVLGFLGDLHTDPAFSHYGLAELEDRVRAFRPDVLCLDITPDDWLRYRHDPAGSDLAPVYTSCLLPLAEAEAMAVAPVNGATEDLRALERAAQADPRLADGDRAERERLTALWRRAGLGPLCCNDEESQAAARLCHEARLRLAPEVEQVLWQQRNDDLVAAVMDVLRENPGRCVLVVVGAEHVYWIREALGGAEGLQLLPPA
ncbi:MAG: hypothetical protein ACM3ZA_07740 [Bacillota bacterium]